MNIDELKAAIDAVDAWNRFDIRTVAAPEHQGSDNTVLEPASDGSGRWVVYYTERGRIEDPVYFDTEDEACNFVHARLTEPPARRGGPMTEAERARADEQRKDAEASGRQMLIDAGYDPDTLQPRQP